MKIPWINKVIQKIQLENAERVERSKNTNNVRTIDTSSHFFSNENCSLCQGAPTLSKSASRANIPPPPPPRPPPPPPARTIIKDLPPLNENQMQKLEVLKSRPRKRPDWASMMKEVESGKKLRHVKCNDRSAPLIERVNKVTADSAGDRRTLFDPRRVPAGPNLPPL